IRAAAARTMLRTSDAGSRARKAITASMKTTIKTVFLTLRRWRDRLPAPIIFQGGDMSAISRAALFLLACLALIPLAAAAWDRGRVERFASLPEGSPNPEGITIDNNGDVYVPGFAPTAPSGPGKLFVFDEDGDLLRSLNVTGSSPALLGLAFHPTNRLPNGRRQLLVIDFGAGNVLSVDPMTGDSSLFMIAPVLIANPGLNALTFDSAGNVYVSDSSQGIIWKTGPAGGA